LLQLIKYTIFSKLLITYTTAQLTDTKNRKPGMHMKSKFKVIEYFTMSCGIGGAIAIVVGTGAIGASLIGFGTIYLGKAFDANQAKIESSIKFGGVTLGTGLFVLGIGLGVAKHADENYPDYPFTQDEEQYLAKIYKCRGCKYFHGHQYNNVDLICALYPSGVEEDKCPDYQRDLD
jgi:hypothetical protein